MSRHVMSCHVKHVMLSFQHGKQSKHLKLTFSHKLINYVYPNKVQKSILYRCGKKNSEINFFKFCEIFDLTPLLLNSLYLSTPSADFKNFCFVLCRNEF